MARRNLLDFTKFTHGDYRPAPHHERICEALEAVARGECRRLMVFMPPRHGKSELASRRFPAWYLGAFPRHQIIAASYNSELASDFGREVRNIVGSREYRALFHTQLAPDSQAANRWHTSSGGSYVAAGVGTAITGRGAHCLLAGSRIQTDVGPVCIENLIMRTSSNKVLSMSARGSLEYKGIEAVSVREADGYYRITTHAGRVLLLTGEHPILSAGQWVRADAIASGDPILCAVPRVIHETGVCVSEVDKARTQSSLLQPIVLDGASCGEERQAVPDVQHADSRIRGMQGCEVLHDVSAQADRASGDISASTARLPGMQSDLHSEVARQVGSGSCQVLQFGMREERALSAYVGNGQPEVEARGNAIADAAAFGPCVSPDAPQDLGERFQEVRGVSFDGTPGSASHRQLADEQRSQQSSHALFAVSQTLACGEGFVTVNDAVAVVERVHSKTTVYDLQVADNHNFFAEGICVHNCLLIDDPLKDREEADSTTTRNRVWDWYTSTAYTRLMPGGAIVLIQTRWHEDDLAGRLLTAQARTGGDKWDVLELKAISDEGDALWPEWYPVPELERIRSVIGPRDWSALYQQSPIPDGKSEFRRDWLRWYQNALSGEGMNVYILVDPAGEKKKTSDRTAMWVVGLNNDGNYYLLDFLYDRLNLTERARELMRLHRKWRPMRVGYEKYGKDSDIEAVKIVQAHENYRFDIVPLGGTLKKEDRIRRLVPLFEAGKVYAPPTMHRTLSDGRTVDILEQFLVEEYDRFPVGAHDDGMDCLARITDPDMNATFPLLDAEPERYSKRRTNGSAWAA
jgi:predicted phage terminase large subunit-like protein